MEHWCCVLWCSLNESRPQHRCLFVNFNSTANWNVDKNCERFRTEHCRTHSVSVNTESINMSEKTEKKLTGLQMPLNVSPELALIIGTKKGEQVCSYLSWGNFSHGTFAGVQAAGDQEAVGLPQREKLAGPFCTFNNQPLKFNSIVPRILKTSSSSLLTRLWREYLGTRGRSVSGCLSISRSTLPTLTSNSGCLGISKEHLANPNK